LPSETLVVAGRAEEPATKSPGNPERTLAAATSER
jgi:hypothetical protein